MALDIYAGSLTRYFTRNWENPGQRLSREQGIAYRVVGPREDQEPPPEDEVRERVEEWRRQLNLGLGEHFPAPLDWPEGVAVPYATERLGETYDALLLWAAYAGIPEETPPLVLPNDLGEDPVCARARELERPHPFAQVVQPTWWLPADFPFVFRGPNVLGDAAQFGSTAGLGRALAALEATLKPPARGPDDTQSVRALARAALSIVQPVVAAAERLRVPLLLDF